MAEPAHAATSVGASAQRCDALDKVTGSAEYAGDLVPENALFAHIAFSNEPHARTGVTSTRIPPANPSAFEG